MDQTGRRCKADGHAALTGGKAQGQCFVPIIQPVALQVGIHPVHLGVVVVMTLSLGLLTPPYGLCALTACSAAGIPVTSILKLLLVMMISLVVVVLLCAMMPEAVLSIPRLLVPQWIS
jgi:TRAP-type C4-dicarboxylate transport system permease large subunit